MVAINNAADWEVDLAPGLLAQVVDLTPYVNTSALKVRHARLAFMLPHCLVLHAQHTTAVSLSCFLVPLLTCSLIDVM